MLFLRSYSTYSWCGICVNWDNIVQLHLFGSGHFTCKLHDTFIVRFDHNILIHEIMPLDLERVFIIQTLEKY